MLSVNSSSIERKGYCISFCFWFQLKVMQEVSKKIAMEKNHEKILSNCPIHLKNCNWKNCFYFDLQSCMIALLTVKVHILWEGHKILRNLNHLFDWQYVGQIFGGDFAKFVAFSEYLNITRYRQNKRLYKLLYLRGVHFRLRVWEAFAVGAGVLLEL